MFREEVLERRHVHVSLERVDPLRLATLGDDKIECLGAGGLDVGARCVEVRVIRDDLARPGDDREKDPLGRAALVRRDDMAEREEALDRLEETEPRRRARVALVAVLDRCPLIS